MPETTIQFLGDIYDIILPLIIGGLIGYIVSRSKKWKSDNDSIREGVLSLLRIELINSYDEYAIHKTPMSVERRDIVEKAYKAYKDLGGNGSIDHMFDVLKNIDPFIVNPTTHNDDEV